MTEMSKYPNTFYRVSVKALIRNDLGEVLVLKENQDTYSLPGGGLDHGEDPIAGLHREVGEELGIEITDIRPLCANTFYLQSKQAWLLWVVFTAQTRTQQFVLGEGVTEARFINVNDLEDSADIFEKLVYEVATTRA